MSSRSGPRGSELVVQDWLQRRPDVEDIRYVGDSGEGPPDFLAVFHGEEVAIEVTRMPLNTGWPEDQRLAFEAELRRVVQSVKDVSEAPRWHVLCKIDRRQPKPPKRHGEWKEHVREALLSGSAPGRLQLMAEGERIGKGVVMEYFPASNDGSLPIADQENAYFVVSSASTRILEEVRAKAFKVRQSERARRYPCWWLVLDDEIVIEYKGITTKEWRDIRDAIASGESIDVWNKVILISSRSGECTAVYERSGETELGVQTRQ